MSNIENTRAQLMNQLKRFIESNRQPAIDAPANDFEQVVNDHAELQAIIADVEAALKPVKTAERKYRDSIAASMDAYLGEELKEGVNNYELSNGRTLKYTRTLERKVDDSALDTARKVYAEADDVPAGVAFDDLLRVKYELDKRMYNKLESARRCLVCYGCGLDHQTCRQQSAGGLMEHLFIALPVEDRYGNESEVLLNVLDIASVRDQPNNPDRALVDRRSNAEYSIWTTAEPQAIRQKLVKLGVRVK